MPEHNGLIERFFRSIKEERVSQHNFANSTQARDTVIGWIDWYNRHRPPQSFKYLSPSEFLGLQTQLDA